jgi:hypothetical protein
MGGTMPGSLKDTLETILVVDDTKAVLEMVVRTPKTQTSKCFQPEADLTLSSWPQRRIGGFSCSFPTWVCQRCQARI